jgi:quinol monooxygenase YgiN
VIIIAGTLHVAAADRQQYLEVAGSATRMARATDGCLDFAQSADPIEPGRINIFERWETDAQLQAFRSLPGDGTQVPPIQFADVHRYRISAVEPA